MESVDSWFLKKLIIGEFPTIKKAEKILADYDYIINVFEDKHNCDSTIYGYFDFFKSDKTTYY